MRIRNPELFVAGAATLSLGCPPTSLYRTAEPTPVGTWQVTAGAGAGQLRDREQASTLPTGQLELGARRGLTNDIDVGARLFVPGLDVNATMRFLRRGPWSFALAPQLAFVRTIATSATTNSLTLFSAATWIATHRFSRSWALTLGPSIGAGIYWPSTGGNARGLWLGSVLGLEWRVGERVWLVPELNGYSVVSGDVPLKGTGLLFGVGARFGL